MLTELPDPSPLFEPPAALLDRFDRVLAQLLPGRTGTCVYGRLEPPEQTGSG